MARTERHSPSQSRRIDVVEPGLYRLALIRGGWRVPCRIFQDDFGGMWAAEINEVECEPVDDPFASADIVHIHSYGEKISDRQYDWLIGIKRWAERHDRSHPSLHPSQPIDPMQLRPLLPKGVP